MDKLKQKWTGRQRYAQLEGESRWKEKGRKEVLESEIHRPTNRQTDRKNIDLDRYRQTIKETKKEGYEEIQKDGQRKR